MRKIQKYIIVLCALAVSFCFIIGCTTLDKDSKISNEEVKSVRFAEDVEDLSAWVTYWNVDVDDEIKVLKPKLESISYFEAYFDSENELYVPDELVDYYKETKDNKYEKYITIVNDKKEDAGEVSLKSVQLLYDIIGDSESASKHIDNIINMQKEYGFDGIEIDYENIKKDMQLWNRYADFINKLYTRCREENIKLRVVLEPGIPIEDIKLEEGPVYVIMCYNLHGTSTDPGEKANEEFIQKTIDKMKVIPGEKEFALSTGGFDWDENNKVVAVDEKTAVTLADKYNAYETRDSNSMYIKFEYSDVDGKKHEVWYADAQTLERLIKVIDRNGYKVSLWKLGGNLF